MAGLDMSKMFRSFVKTIKCTNFLLLLAGCRLSAEPRLHAINIIGRIAFNLWYIRLLCIEMPRLVKGGHLFGDLTVTAECIFCLSSNLAMVRAGNDAIKIIDQIYSFLIDKHKQRLSQLDLCMTIPVVIVFCMSSALLVTNMETKVYVFTGVDDMGYSATLFLAIIMCFMNMFDFAFMAFYSLASMTTYYFAKSCSEHFLKTEAYLRNGLASEYAIRKQFDSLRHRYRLFGDCRRQLNSVLGKIPFLWSALVFNQITMGITEYIVNPEFYGKTCSTILGVHFMLYISATAVHLFMAGMATAEFEKSRIIALRILINNFDNLKATRNEFLLETLINPAPRASACGMFTLDKQLMIRFASYVIPFAAMIITAAIEQKRAHQVT